MIPDISAKICPDSGYLAEKVRIYREITGRIPDILPNKSQDISRNICTDTGYLQNIRLDTGYPLDDLQNTEFKIRSEYRISKKAGYLVHPCTTVVSAQIVR